jgi:outer membrane protein OmpA-like peptidoglycan-associated protein
MKSRPMHVVSAFVLIMLFSFSGFAQQGTMDRYKSASLEGTTGLFKTWDADALRQGEFNLSFGYDLVNRDPGQLKIGNFKIGAAVGLHDRLEVFGAVDVNRRIWADSVVTGRNPSIPEPSVPVGGDGGTYFTQTAPFVDTDEANGLGDFRLGAKLNLLSEGRGNPVTTGIAGFFTLPGHKNDVEGLNKGLSSGAFQGGFAWLLSKTAADFVRMHLNLGSNFYSNPEIDGSELADFQNEFTYSGGVEFPAHKPYRIITELYGNKYYGDGSSGLNPKDVVDLIVGMRVYPRDWVSLGGGYLASLNHVPDGDIYGPAADYHGFVVQGAFGKRRNDPPTLACAAANPKILQEDTTNVRANAVDPEGAPLTYKWETTGGKIDGTGDTVTFDTADAAPGEYEVTVFVADRAHEVSCTTPITVLKKNYPPTVTLEGPAEPIVQGESAVINAKASDPNKDPLTYAWTVNGQQIAASGPQITFGSEGRAPGTYDVKVVVSDGEESAEDSCTVTVKEKPNQMPVVECLTATMDVIAGESIELRARANDPEGGALTYTWSSPVGRIVGSGETVRFDATGAKAGSYTITVTVQDPRGGKASCTMAVNVSERLSVTKEDCGYFGYLSTRVDNCAKAILDDLSVRMKNEPQLRANIIGYVDGRYEASNKTLGERRAKAVAAYLEKKGVESSQLTVTNGGSNNQIGDLSTSAGRRLNRRVEIELSVR